jgi:hypothetical protein
LSGSARICIGERTAPLGASCGRAGIALCLLLSVLAATLSGPCAAQAGEDVLAVVMRAMSQRSQGQARFEERQFLSVLKAPLESSGELRFTAPDRLEKRTVSPKPEILVLERGTLSIDRGSQHFTVSVQDHPQLGAFVEGLRATLMGDRQTLERYYTIDSGRDGVRWWINLTPRDPVLSAVVQGIRIIGQQASIRSVETLRANGDRSMMRITDTSTP